ncbi:MAG: insulinase family protein [Kofleriaceae bacterium]
MTFSARAWVSVLAMIVVSSAILACNPSTPKFAFNHAERRGRIKKNGLRFVVMPDATTQLVEVDVRYEVGAREDPPGKAGLAHLVEHLMFQQKPDGPDTKPLMHFIAQQAVNMNAYTNSDTTHYMINARAEQLDAMVKVEAMRMHYGCQTISEDEFLREREVVRNEIRGGNRTPEGRIPQIAMSSLYPKGHAYEQMVGGDDVQLSTITLADACEFMKKYYVPERATVIVAGGVVVEDAAKSIEKWFSVVAQRTPAPRRKVEPVHVTRGQKTVELDIERPWVTVSWALPDATTPEGEAANFGVWGAFFDTANKATEYECATQAQPAILGGQEAPMFLIALELKSMDKLDECLDFVWKAAKKAYRGWDEGSWEQLEESKNRNKAQFISSLEPLFGNGARTDRVGDLVQFTREFDFDSQELYIFHELDKIGKFDGAKVGAAVKKALDPDKARVVVFKPSKQGIHGDQRSKVVFRTRSHETVEQPDVDPSEARRPFKVATELKGLSNAQRYTLGNGMRVVLLPVDAMPVVSAQLIFDVGDSIGVDNPLIASTAADFLNGPMDSEAVGRAGVSMGCGTTPDHTICGARGMNIYLDVVVKGLERMIRAGQYSQQRIENWQKQTKIQYKLRRPQQQLEYQRQQLIGIFGPDHAYTKTGAFLPDAAGKIGKDTLTAFRDKHYSAANATLVIAGKFDAKKAESIIKETFGAWGKGHKDVPVARDLPKRIGPVHVGVIGEDDPQMDVTIMYPSPAGIDGQQAARMVLTTMLNDKMWDIRAKLGATYGTYARRDARLGPSLYDLGGAVDAPRAGEALKAMRDGVDDLRKGVDFDVGFVRARRKVIQTLLGESTMSRELSSRLGFIARYNLPPSYYNSLLQQVAAVSLAQVKALIAHELDISNEVIVTLGDRNAVVKAFADAGINDVKLVDPEYK